MLCNVQFLILIYGNLFHHVFEDMDGLLSTWKDIVEHAQAVGLAADEGDDGAVPVILHRAIGQTLYVVQDHFNEQVSNMVVDPLQTYHECPQQRHRSNNRPW
ncbi:unnamed protein product [Victoria cruziana]